MARTSVRGRVLDSDRVRPRIRTRPNDPCPSSSVKIGFPFANSISRRGRWTSYSVYSVRLLPLS